MTKRLPPSRQPRSKNASRPVEEHPETQALLRNLDKIYERLRERARAEWLRSYPDGDPSDACVSVRITCGSGEKVTVSGTSRPAKE